MFKMMRDGWRLPRVAYALKAAQAAVDHGRLDVARDWISKAYNTSLDTTFGRTDLINFRLSWAMLSLDLSKRDDTALADQCKRMADLLMARLAAGDYYREPPAP